MKIHKKGNVINEKEFFINTFRKYSLKSVRFSKLLTITYDDFNLILK